jgi:NADH:ubiquinone oxidoreductase subunit 2 (subunit N)
MSAALIAWTIAIAAIGPAAAGLVWLGLARWPRVARAALWAALAVAHVAAWGVFWLSYRGEEVLWRGLHPTLLGATLAAVTELAILLALARAHVLAPRRLPTVVLGLTAGASAVVYGAYVDNLLLIALFFPVTTLGAAMVSLGDPGRSDLRGLFSLALADAVVIAGLTALEARLGTTIVGPDPGATVANALMLGGAALKAGAIPGFGAWMLTAADGPAALMAPAVRGQALILAAVAALQAGESQEADPAAVVAAVAILLNAVMGVVARRGPTVMASALGSGAGVAFLALSLGGGVGARAFLVLAPVYVLATGTAVLVGWEASEEDRAPRERDRRPPRAAWSWLGFAALLVVLGSLVGLPPGGGFPGTWLTLSLATTRGLTEPLLLGVAAATGIGLAVTFLAALPLAGTVRTRAVPAVVGAASALGLLYVGLQPVRLGIGWWLRVENELGLPTLLPAAAAPDLPPIGGLRLAAVLLPAVVLVGAVVALGRGIRESRTRFVPMIRNRAETGAERARRIRARVTAAVEGPRRLARRATAQGLGFGVAVVFEVIAAVLAARLLLIGARSGFL